LRTWFCGAIAIAAMAVLTAAAPGAASEPRIVGGTVAPSRAYPWMVSLVAARSEPVAGHGCGASLIGERTVLTATHCVAGLRPSEFDAVVGIERLSQEGSGTRVDVARYALHPGFADVALIDLAEPVPTAPVALATPADAALFAPGSEATAIGFGLRKENGQLLSEELRQVEVPIVGDAECRAAYRGVGGFEPKVNVCAGSRGLDTCQGDSGGPLFVRDPSGAPLQVGVTSSGRGCGRPRFPGIYVDVPAVLDFVTDPAPVFAPFPERRMAKITGEPRVGERLTCDGREWQGEDIRFRYRWTAGFDPRPRSRRRTFTPRPNHAGKRVACSILGTTAGGFIQQDALPVRIHGNGGAG
jgi:trypsin